MSKKSQFALMQAQTIDATSGEVPDWIHLLPADAEIRTMDGRGPYRMLSAEAVIAATAGMKLPIDENHSIDLAGPRGEPAPARGYIVEMQSRNDGVWGRVEWNAAGRALMADQAYLGISPVIMHDAKGQILGIARASLTNRPNLRGLTTLHSEETEDMDLLMKLAKMLGLGEDATEATVMEALAARIQGKPEAVTALQSQLGQIGIALGVANDPTGDAILAAARAKGATTDNAVILGLQSELATLATQLNAMTSASAKTKAETFVDGEIVRGRVGVKLLRDHYISMHMQDPARVEKELGALPVLNSNNRIAPAPLEIEGAQVSLQSEQVDVASMLGIDPAAFAKTLKEERL